jgi:hypothetical protein
VVPGHVSTAPLVPQAPKPRHVPTSLRAWDQPESGPLTPICETCWSPIHDRRAPKRVLSAPDPAAFPAPQRTALLLHFLGDAMESSGRDPYEHDRWGFWQRGRCRPVGHRPRRDGEMMSGRGSTLRNPAYQADQDRSQGVGPLRPQRGQPSYGPAAPTANRTRKPGYPGGAHAETHPSL